MTKTKKGLFLAFTIYIFQIVLIFGYIFDWLPIHPIVIIPTFLYLINSKIENRELEDLGLIFPFPGYSLLLALLLAVSKGLLFAQIFFINEIVFNIPAIDIKSSISLLKELAIAVLILATWEELSSRGFIQTRLQDGWGFFGVILSAMMFASLHIPSAVFQFNYTPQTVLINFVEMLISGFVLSYIYWKTRSTFTTIAVHGLRNFLFGISSSYIGVSAKEIHMLQPGLQMIWSTFELLLVFVYLKLLYPGEKRLLDTV